VKPVRLTPARLLLLLALAACAGSPPEHFYTLGGDQAHPSSAAPRCRIVVRPVTVPALVDRPQMVLRIAPNQVFLAEQSRWAEPLKDAIARVLADDLSQDLHDAAVAVSADATARDAHYQVLLDVRRFESMRGVAALIEADWIILDHDNVTLKAGRSLVREPTGGEGYDALVAAHDRALAGVSRQIAGALRALPVAR
jgi:uncharacterized lipoprotein YmbA